MEDTTTASAPDPGGTPGRVIFEVHDLTKSFGGLRAVDNCSFSVRERTITGLIGPNGAGKTTVFNLVTGFIRRDSGRVILEGEDISNLRPDQIFAKGLCRTFQIPKEHMSMSVLENLMLVPYAQYGEHWWTALFGGKRLKEEEERLRLKAIEVMEYLEITHVADEYAGNLSGGQKKLLELGRTLMADPKIVLLDEPAAGVNRTLLKSIVSNIRSMAEDRGITFLLIEHDMNMVMSLCNPVIVLSEGRKLAEGPPEEVRTNKDVLEAYLGGQYAAAGS